MSIRQKARKRGAESQPSRTGSPGFWPAEIISPDQVRQALGELESLRSWLKDYDRSVRVGAVTAAPRPPMGPDTKLLHGEIDWAKVKLEQVDDLISDIEARLNSAPEVHVSLPAFPLEEVKKDLANWFRNNISPKILLSFSGDSTLSGGMVVRTRNHLYNFSLSRQLWEQRSLIPGIIRDA